ncbi:hypothetical protein FHS18_006853 [Paenibacillus phyllosphaerae]|uniref:Uncharacterized protein n=1 Tax=Paenibacillus phyllosphaerae TaxID=274593 RepID=A0A7W5B5C4_9BACL|nr:hypothetical protein [Paenibacillus phyllosphaerae]MBB3114710.1 hypothetical protein [Paenibacillus phyllosphaerae]
MSIHPVNRLVRTPVTRVEPIPPYAKHTYVDHPDQQPYGGGLPLYAILPLKQALEHARAWLQQSQILYKSASALTRLRTSPLRKSETYPAELIEHIHTVIEQVNKLQAVYAAGEQSLHPELYSSIQEPLERYASWRTGLSFSLIERRWEVNEAQLRSLCAQDPVTANRMWSGPEGIARLIGSFLEDIASRPFYDMLRPSAAATHFRQYHYSSDSLSLWKGLMLNRTV